jgi:hypothetical protein
MRIQLPISFLLATLSMPAWASSHREAPAIAIDPVADSTDLWAWVDKEAQKVYIVASYNPLEEPAGGPNFNSFGDDVLYEIHIARGTGVLNDAVTYQFRFDSTPFAGVDPGDLGQPLGGGKEFFYQLSGQKQTYSIWKIEGGVREVLAEGVEVAPVNIGPRTDAVLRGGAPYDDAFAATFIQDMGEEGRVFAGPRDDGFYVDLGGVFDLANLRASGTAQDTVSGYNCHTIALEIPTAVLTGTGDWPDDTAGDDTLLGIWTSASRRKVTIIRKDGSKDVQGPWVQVSRLGLPLINEVVIGLQDKDKYSRTSPKTDVANFAAYFNSPVLVRDAEAVGVYGSAGTQAPDDVRTNRAGDILNLVQLRDLPSMGAHNVPIEPGKSGDVLRVDLALDYRDLGFPNGRPIPNAADPRKEGADVVDVLASYVLLKAFSGVSDGVSRNDKAYLTEFPYLALPHRGFDGGHGRVAD